MSIIGAPLVFPSSLLAVRESIPRLAAVLTRQKLLQLAAEAGLSAIGTPAVLPSALSPAHLDLPALSPTLSPTATAVEQAEQRQWLILQACASAALRGVDSRQQVSFVDDLRAYACALLNTAFPIPDPERILRHASCIQQGEETTPRQPKPDADFALCAQGVTSAPSCGFPRRAQTQVRTCGSAHTTTALPGRGSFGLASP